MGREHNGECMRITDTFVGDSGQVMENGWRERMRNQVRESS